MDLFKVPITTVHRMMRASKDAANFVQHILMSLILICQIHRIHWFFKKFSQEIRNHEK
jgi:hypothetical protein